MTTANSEEKPSPLSQYGKLPPAQPFRENERDHWPEVMWIEHAMTLAGCEMPEGLCLDESIVRYGSRDAALEYLVSRAFPRFRFHPHAANAGSTGGVVATMVMHPTIARMAVMIYIYAAEPGGTPEPGSTYAGLPLAQPNGAWSDEEFPAFFERWAGTTYERYVEDPTVANADPWWYRRRKVDQQEEVIPPAFAPSPVLA